MNKKVLKIALFCFALGVFSPIVVGIVTKLGEKETQEKRIASLPNFNLTDMEGQPFGRADLSNHTEKIFVLFNTTCEYCQDEAKQFAQQLDKFKKNQLLFISPEPLETIKEFAKQYNLLHHDNIHFLHDRQDRFSTLFGANSVPYFLIYNSGNRLIYQHKGAVKVENLLKQLGS